MKRVLLTAAAAMLAACNQVNLDAHFYPCTGTDPSECPGGWRCGLDGVCHDLDAGAYLCLTDDDCEASWQCGLHPLGDAGLCHDRVPAPYPCDPTAADAGGACDGWRCGINGVCHSLDAGAYPCAVDSDCQAGWRCGLDGVCIDASQDGLAPDASYLDLASPVRVNPTLLLGAPDLFGVGAPFPDSQGAPEQALAFAYDGGFYEFLMASSEMSDNPDQSQPFRVIPTTEQPVHVVCFERDVLFSTASGVWLFTPDVGGSGGGLEQVGTLAGADLRASIEQFPLVAAFTPGAYSLFGSDGAGGLMPMALDDAGSTVAALVYDGGAQTLVDMASSPQSLVAVTANGLFFAPRETPYTDPGKPWWDAGVAPGFIHPMTQYPYPDPDWQPFQPAGNGVFFAQALCPSPPAGTPLQPTRLLSAPPQNQNQATALYVEGVGATGPAVIASLYSAPADSGVETCNTSGFTVPADLIFSDCAPCPSGQDGTVLLAQGMQNDSGYTYLQAVCPSADGGPPQLFNLGFNVSGNNQAPGCSYGTPNTASGAPTVFLPDAVVSQTGMPAVIALAGAHGQLWTSATDATQLTAVTLDGQPTEVVDTRALPGLGVPFIAFDSRGFWAEASPMGLTLAGAGNGGTGILSVDGQPFWIMQANGAVLDGRRATTGVNGSPPVAALVAPNALPLQPPLHAVLSGDSDGGWQLLLSSNDALLSADVSALDPTATQFTGNPPPVQLQVRIVPAPRVPIISFATLSAGPGEPGLLDGYALTPDGAFYFVANSEQQWTAQAVPGLAGSWLKVWADGRRGRLGFSDGTVLSLPSRVRIADPLPTAPSDAVLDFEHVCGNAFALSGTGLYRLAPDPAGGPVGHWIPETATSALPPGFSFSTAAIFQSSDGLFLFDAFGEGTLFGLSGPCAQ